MAILTVPSDGLTAGIRAIYTEFDEAAAGTQDVVCGIARRASAAFADGTAGVDSTVYGFGDSKG